MFLSLALFLANSYLPFPFKMNKSNDSMENNLATMNITPEIGYINSVQHKQW